MPRNGSGQYNPLTNTWNPPVNGVLATGSDFQAQLNDISAAISQSVSKDGQTPMTASFPMGNNSIVGIASGTAAAPSISPINDTNTGVYFPAADTVAIATGGVKRVEVDASGNWALGVTNPLARIHAARAGGVTLRLDDLSTNYWDITNDNNLNFNRGGTEHARITNVGNLLVGTSVDSGYRATFSGGSSVGGTTIDTILLRNSGYGGSNIASTNQNELVLSQIDFTTEDVGVSNFDDGIIRFSTRLDALTGGALTERARITSGGNWLVGYTTSNGAYKLQVNSQIFATSSTIATSDGRYKENITPIDGALNLVKELNPVQFSWKKHPIHAFDTETPTVGFIAQELQQVLADRPYLNSIVKCNECTITAAEYETIQIEPSEEEIKDEDGNVLVSAKPAITEQRLVKPAVNEKFLGIAEGNLIAILTKAIQEQQTLIEALTARLTALEAK